MNKAFAFYSPYTSLFSSYPRLRLAMAPPTGGKLSQDQINTIVGIGKAVRATKYDDRNEQRAFLDEKTALLVRSINFMVSNALIIPSGLFHSAPCADFCRPRLVRRCLRHQEFVSPDRPRCRWYYSRSLPRHCRFLQQAQERARACQERYPLQRAETSYRARGGARSCERGEGGEGEGCQGSQRG